MYYELKLKLPYFTCYLFVILLAQLLLVIIFYYNCAMYCMLIKRLYERRYPKHIHRTPDDRSARSRMENTYSLQYDATQKLARECSRSEWKAVGERVGRPHYEMQICYLKSKLYS